MPAVSSTSHLMRAASTCGFFVRFYIAPGFLVLMLMPPPAAQLRTSLYKKL